MTRPMTLLSATYVIARRDFLAIVATPTFLLFLLAPLFFISLSAIGGMSAAQLATNAGSTELIMAQVPAGERAAFIATDARLRQLTGGPGRTPRLIVMTDTSAHREAMTSAALNPEVQAILTGNAAAPTIAEREPRSTAGRYLTLLADTVARAGAGPAARAVTISEPSMTQLGSANRTGRAAQIGLGYGAVFILFLLILMLGGQTVGTLAEEKGNKVIEILAAAVPMESVFYGKLIGMLGVALLFIAFWGGILALGGSIAMSQLGVPTEMLATVQPALGWPLFLLLALAYFLMGFMLLGAVFLGLGALASSVREIQMLSLPITLFQVGMFTLGSMAANVPGSQIATIAAWLPWSSPYAMAARGATDAALWPHALALGWQALWLVASVAVAVRLFRYGVLRSGPLFSWRRAKAQTASVAKQD